MTAPHHWAWGHFLAIRVPYSCTPWGQEESENQCHRGVDQPFTGDRWELMNNTLGGPLHPGWDDSEAHATTLLPRALQQGAAPSVYSGNWLPNTPCIRAFPSSLPAPPLPVLSGTTSQINYFIQIIVRGQHLKQCRLRNLSMSLSMNIKPTHVSPKN